MSYYYNYFAGYKDLSTNKIYPLGPYTSFNKLVPILSKSRSFASDLYEAFDWVPVSQASEELLKEFEYERGDGVKEFKVKYLPFSRLPQGSFIESGYFLISDVQRYEEDSFDFDGFYEKLSPQIYLSKLENQMKFGPSKPKVNEFGESYIEHDASDYMYYAYPNYNSREFESALICNTMVNLVDYTKNIELLVLETEG